jgi:hypothetical protein
MVGNVCCLVWDSGRKCNECRRAPVRSAELEERTLCWDRENTEPEHLAAEEVQGGMFAAWGNSSCKLLQGFEHDWQALVQWQLLAVYLLP